LEGGEREGGSSPRRSIRGANPRFADSVRNDRDYIRAPASEGGRYRGAGLAAGDGDQMALRANGAGGGGELLVTCFDGLREGQERRGVDGGDSTTIGESNGNFRGSDVLREFGDGQEIEAAGGEKCGVDGAAEPLEGARITAKRSCGL